MTETDYTKAPKRWTWPLAFFRLSDKAVCRWSRHGVLDHHDYPDSEIDEPWHFYTYTCERCGKEFTI